MARINCKRCGSQAGCGCVIAPAGDGSIVITGDGSPGSPYSIGVGVVPCGCNIGVGDGSIVVTGDGSPTDPYEFIIGTVSTQPVVVETCDGTPLAGTGTAADPIVLPNMQNGTTSYFPVVACGVGLNSIARWADGSPTVDSAKKYQTAFGSPLNQVNANTGFVTGGDQAVYDVIRVSQPQMNTRGTGNGGNRVTGASASAGGIGNIAGGEVSAVFGASNQTTLGAYGSLVAGGANLVDGKNSLVGGLRNTLTASADQSIVGGFFNDVGSQGGIVQGMSNTVAAGADNSTVVGETNVVAATANASTVFGVRNNVTSNTSATLGTQLLNQGLGQTIIGRANIGQGTPGTSTQRDSAFIIGNGTTGGTPTRSDAFRVRWDGAVQFFPNKLFPTAATNAAAITGLTANVSTANAAPGLVTVVTVAGVPQFFKWTGATWVLGI